jgi:hypothetical protein
MVRPLGFDSYSGLVLGVYVFLTLDVEIGFSGTLEVTVVESNESTLPICLMITRGSLERTISVQINIDSDNTQGTISRVLSSNPSFDTLADTQC